MTIGEKIKALCKESRIDQKDLAESIGYTQESMSRWLKGTRKVNVDALVKIAKYFDVSTDYLLGLSDKRNYHGFLSGDDALEYCKKAKESAWKCWYKVANFDVTEISATSLANNTQACAYFEREILRWEYEIPHMIHSLADGTWKEADRKTEPQSEKRVGNKATLTVNDGVAKVEPQTGCNGCKHYTDGLIDKAVCDDCRRSHCDNYEPQTERSE